MIRKAALPILVLTWGCGGTPATAVVPKDPTPLAKCSVAKSQASPLVTEWPASEKAHLESMLDSQAVVVSYTGCEMRILGSCRVPGKYAFHRTTLSEDTIEIKNADDLYANVPIGAVALEAELEASGRLAIHTTVVGQMRLVQDTASITDLPGCEDATHVITAVSIGAFDMISGGMVRAGGGVRAGALGAGAQHRSEETTLRSSGSADGCRQTNNDPHVDCRSPLQVFLLPVDRLTAVAEEQASEAPAAASEAPKPAAGRDTVTREDERAAYRLREGTMAKLKRGDAKGCLADLDKADRLDPTTADEGYTQSFRYMCELAANRCTQGIARAQRWFVKYTGKKLTPAEIDAQIGTFAPQSKCQAQ